MNKTFEISIHALREEGDGQGTGFCGASGISIHALREEGDVSTSIRSWPTTPISIHALREEGDGGEWNTYYVRKRISIHALREEGDMRVPPAFAALAISIHALREEGDRAVPQLRVGAERHFYPRPPRGGRRTKLVEPLDHPEFLSTPSARRATMRARQASYTSWVFLSTPSARRATFEPLWVALCVEISIHALREEGDAAIVESFFTAFVFLSTPSARRATGGGFPERRRRGFLSTPSARRATEILGLTNTANLKFLSTPSARRATSGF